LIEADRDNRIVGGEQGIVEGASVWQS